MMSLGTQYPYKFRYHTFKNYWLNRIQYKIPPDPYKTIKIRPREIKQILSYYGGNNNNKKLVGVHTNGIGQIKSGNWDDPKHRHSIHNNYIIQGIIERFIYDFDWEETKYYKEKRKMLKKENIHKKRGFQSIYDYLQSDCENYDQLYNEIKVRGYQPNHQGTCKQPGKTQPVRDQLEVLVAIGRKGNIYFFDGYHRFGIAWVLDLEIPVHVAYRHKQWQKTRDEIYVNGFSRKSNEKLHSHPDLQDILPHGCKVN